MNDIFCCVLNGRVCVAAAAASLFLLVGQARTQEPAQAKSKPKSAKVQPPPSKDTGKSQEPDDAKPTEIQIFPLKSANAAEAADLLKVMLGMKTAEGESIPGHYVAIGIDQRTNSIIVSAPAEQINKIRSILNKLDVAADNEPPAQELSVVPLRFIEPDQTLQEALRLVLTGAPTQGNFTVDRQRKAVILWGDDKARKAATALLENLERQSQRQRQSTPSNPDVQVRVIWLVNGHEEVAEPTLPGDLKEVLPALAKLGINQPRLAAQTLVNVTSGKRFQTRGVAKLESPCQFSVNGQFSGGDERPKLQIDIRANRPGASPELCSLQTEISAPLGHLVVLGLTPTDATTSAFVVQVLGK